MKSLIVIGGTTKGGTTSLYKYLSDHPQVAGSSRKETRFFLEPAYPVPSLKRYARDGIDAYWIFFPRDRENMHLLEATPDYLYSKNAARELWAHFGKNLKVIFILRDPVARFESWYRFALQNNLIDKGTSPSEFIALQVGQPGENTPQHRRVLEQGLYHRHLECFSEFVQPANIYCMSFNGLSQIPRNEITNLAQWLGLDCTFYDTYVFTVENNTMAVRWPFLHQTYLRSTRWLRDRIMVHQKSHALLRRIKQNIEPVYLSLIERSFDDGQKFSNSDKTFLETFYAEERDWLAHLPWGPCDQHLRN